MTAFERARGYFQGKNVLVFGLGLLGGASGDVNFLIECGANVRVTDSKSKAQLETTLKKLKDLPVTYSLGGHRDEDIIWADIILRNPSVPYNHPLLALARNHNKPIEMRTALFVHFSGIPIIGITGTRGKTTTTMMIYEICRQLIPQKKVLLGGNIAHQSDLELLKDISEFSQTLAVMELSSWQLQGFRDRGLASHIAVVTNLYPDHLNTYKDLDTYYTDKKVILDYQLPGDIAVLNRDQPEFRSWAATAPARVCWFSASGVPENLHLQIPGEHNLANAAAAMAVAEELKLNKDQVINVLNNFAGVPFRQQTVAVKNGVTYINDTTATTPVAAAIALKTHPGAIVICGGSDKNLPVDDLIKHLNLYAKLIVLLAGNGTDRIKDMLAKDKVTAEVDNMVEAVNRTAAVSKPGDTVLLTPGFTSFGLFNNEFDRGEQFNTCVQNLPSTNPIC